MKTALALAVFVLTLAAVPAAAAPAGAADLPLEIAELVPSGQEPLEMAPPNNQCKKTFQTATFGGHSDAECVPLCETRCADQGGTLKSSYWGGARDPICYCTCCRN